MKYKDFLASKVRLAPAAGFEPLPFVASLFGFQSDIVSWAIRRGRAAVFADTGLGKTRIQCEWARQVVARTKGRVLILAPLAVAAQTVREAASLGIDIEHSRDGHLGEGITITNYERRSYFQPGDFVGIVLDESSILKSHDGKTRTEIIESFAQTQYRLACTATPSPNDHTELANHSEFLGIMPRSEMLATFFTHDGGETQSWRLKRHGRVDFWRWVCSWAATIRKPSDLGYPDGAFELPPLRYHDHVVESAPADACLLIPLEALTLEEQRTARRSSLALRVRETARLVNNSADPWIVWCDLNAESEALRAAIHGSYEVTGSDAPDDKESRLIGFSEGHFRVLITKPSIAGFGLNWQHCSNVAFVGVTHSFEAFYQAIRRCWRFGQTHPVDCHIITAESEGAVVANLRRKERQAAEMAAETQEHVREFVQMAVRGSTRQLIRYDPKKTMRIPKWMEA